MRTRRRLVHYAAMLAVASYAATAAATSVLYAVGQAFAPATATIRQILWSIDLSSGAATQIAPIAAGIAGLATAPDGTLHGAAD